MSRKFKILSILYFSFFMLSLLIFHTREDLYVRPDSYFTLLAFMVIIVLIQILMMHKMVNAIEKTIIFLEILAIPLSFSLTQQALYHTIIDRDSWVHWLLTEYIIKKEYIPPYSELPIPYVAMPNFHLLTAITILIMGLSYKWALYLSGGISTLLLLTLTSLLMSKRAFKNEKLAYLSSLLVASSDNVLGMVGESITPNGLGVAMSFLTLYLIMFLLSIQGLIVTIVLLTSLVLEHSISYVFAIYQLLILTLLAGFYRQKVMIQRYIILLLFSIALAILEWAYYSVYYFNSFIRLLKVLYLRGISLEEFIEGHHTIPIIKVILSRIGTMIFLSIAGIGVLYVLRKNYNNYIKISLSLIESGILIGSLSFIIPALSSISRRFWYYGEVIGSIFFSIVLLKVLNSTLNHKKVLYRYILIALFIFILSLAMFKASVVNYDNPLVPEYTPRSSWYDSELSAAKFIVWHCPRYIASDWDYYHSVNIFKTITTGYPYVSIDYSNHPPMPRSFNEITTYDGIFVLRTKLIKERYFELGGRWDKMGYPPLNKEEYAKVMTYIFGYRSIIYNNPTVIVTLI